MKLFDGTWWGCSPQSKYIRIIAITGATSTMEVLVINWATKCNCWYWTGWLPNQRLKAYGFVELFSGEAWTSRCMRNLGIQTASFDIKFGQSDRNPLKQDYMDLCTDAGFAFLWLMTLHVSALVMYSLHHGQWEYWAIFTKSILFSYPLQTLK